MAGAHVAVDVRGLEVLIHELGRFTRLQMDDLGEQLGAEMESQVRRRIQVEKRAPDGSPWAPWSEGYRRTRHGGHSLMRAKGGLLDTIQHVVSGNAVSVGSNLVYAATHQVGRGGIPARPFLGLSAENENDLEQVAADWLDRQFRDFSQAAEE